MRRTASRRGLDLRHKSRSLLRSDLEEYDLVIVMGTNHVRDIARMDRSVVNTPRVRLFREFDPHVNGDRPIPEVPDPWYGGDDGFEEVYEIVDRTCDALLDRFARGTLP